MKSLDTVATAALARCEATGACDDASGPERAPPGGERVLEGVAWTGYADAPTTPTGELAYTPAPPAPGLVRWTLACDRPGCAVTLHADARTDSEARRAVTLHAEATGWQISRWRDVPVDLCPEHREEGWAEGPPRRVLEAGITDSRRKR